MCLDGNMCEYCKRDKIIVNGYQAKKWKKKKMTLKKALRRH